MDKELQCPVCGRIREDWSNEETKHKAISLSKDKQRKDDIDRSADYKRWRWKFGFGCYVNDIDQVEWKVIDGEKRIVSILELTMIDGDRPVPETYLQAILDRFTKRDGQADIIRYIATKLKVDAYIVAYRYNLEDFWLYNLSKNKGWKYFNKDEYRRWIHIKGRENEMSMWNNKGEQSPS